MSETKVSLEEALEHYRGRHTRGPDGDAEFRKSEIRTNILALTDESLHSDTMSLDEADDMLAYYGWNIWDMLGTRATEGESGLVPRQEYEALASVEYVQKFPELYDMITAKVGGDGVVDMGAVARREIGTKSNCLHAWCAGATFVTGRGLLMDLGYVDASYKAQEIARAMQFTRRLYKGLWGDQGGVFATQRGYRVPVLEGTPWLERFRDEATWFDDDPELHKAFMGFNATTQLLVFLLHFDNRLGLGDSGPYPTEDGGFMIVRDHFLNDPVYHWFDVAEELPHAVTQAMYFKPPEGMDVIVNDLSTTFTRPASYLPYLRGVAVYARDKWDTPISDIRLVHEDEMRKMTQIAQQATMRLYKRIASMSRRDRIHCGVQNYVLDWLLPWVRLADVWEEAVDMGWLEWDKMTSDAYYPVEVEKRAGTVWPEVVIATPGACSLQPGKTG